MKISILATVIIVAATVCHPQQPDRGNMLLTYELYRWKAANGWNFSLLPTTNRQKTVQEVFNKKSSLHGTEELRRKISEFPRGTAVVWLDRLTLSGVRVKGTKRLKYPPKEIVDIVQHDAAAMGIKVSGPQ
jgi:hypothetical protein